MNKIVDFFIRTKAWIVGVPLIGIGLWWLIKILLCLFTGVCIL